MAAPGTGRGPLLPLPSRFPFRYEPPGGGVQVAGFLKQFVGQPTKHSALSHHPIGALDNLTTLVSRFVKLMRRSGNPRSVLALGSRSRVISWNSIMA